MKTFNGDWLVENISSLPKGSRLLCLGCWDGASIYEKGTVYVTDNWGGIGVEGSGICQYSGWSGVWQLLLPFSETSLEDFL